MITQLRRRLLVSTAAVFSLTLAPALVAALCPAFGSAVVSTAFADSDNHSGRDGSGHDSGDDNGSDDSSDDNGSGGHGSDDNGADDHGSNRDDRSDTDSGSDDNGADDSSDDNGSGGHGSDDDGADDSNHDDDGSSADTSSARDARGRQNGTRVVVNAKQLAGLKNGTMVAIDQNGRKLRYEIEWEHNRAEVKVKAPHGSVAAVTIAPAK